MSVIKWPDPILAIWNFGEAGKFIHSLKSSRSPKEFVEGAGGDEAKESE